MTAFLIAAGGFFSLAISFTQLIIKDKKPINYLSFAIFFLYGVCVLSDTTYRPGTEYLTPHLLYVNYPLLYLLGPFVFFYFLTLADGCFRFKKRYIVLFAPAVGCLIYFLPFFLKSAQAKMAAFPLFESETGLSRALFDIFDYSLLPWIFLCFLLTSHKTSFIWKNNKDTPAKELRIIRGYIIVWILTGAFLAIADIRDQVGLYRIGLLSANILTAVLFFITLRFPDFFNAIQAESSRAKYKNSSIKGINTGAVLERMDDLLECRKTFRDETLTLRKMSDQLEIQPHQLSEIISKKFATTFNSFINTYRVEAAKKMLLEKKKTGILAIAFDCGFNSKSTFNKVFHSHTGTTPTEFRKKNRPDL